ncbi:MAG: N-acetylmuramoyl-L-alanine amidase [Lachnospiraceae bacterium]|nr:N-acetylmuramoyl-L-alanine amidase [Lachnospiraceae bacterium]
MKRWIPYLTFVLTLFLISAWIPADVYAAGQRHLASGTYTIYSALSKSMVLDIQNASKEPGANLQLYEANGTAAQQFRVTEISGGSYRIEPVCSSLSLDTAGGGAANGVNVRQYADNGSAAQRWRIVPAGGRYYSLSPECAPGFNLEAEGASFQNETNIQIYQENKTRAQNFAFVPVIPEVSAVQAPAAEAPAAEEAPEEAPAEENADAEETPAEEEEAEAGELPAEELYPEDNTEEAEEGLSSAEEENPEEEDPAEEEGAPAETAASGSHLVAIDAGHQLHGNSDLEPNAPGSSVMKAKVTSGTEGEYSGLPEYEMNLMVALKLQKELESRGYAVYMIRSTHEVDISNAERAQKAAEAGAEILIRLHGNSVENHEVRGVMGYQPSSENPYLSASVIADSQRLTRLLVEGECAATGLPNRGILDGDDMTGINWAVMPVSIIEMGFMSNPDDDYYMASDYGQDRIAIGLADGVDAYYS